ncbi:MAG: hypothetical protein ABFC18_03140 [Rikenellaceae bacterium]
MKKLFLFLFIVFLISCEKDSRCWECTTKLVTVCSGQASYDTVISTDIYDKSQNEINEFIKSQTYISSIKQGNITCTVRSSCTCNKE